VGVPYRQPDKSAKGTCAAFLEIVWVPRHCHLYGGLLVIDGEGRPLEFVHTDLKAPSGFLWPITDVLRLGTREVAHALFDACQRAPVLVACRSSLGSPDFCRDEVAPTIPFAWVERTEDGEVSWTWLNSRPPDAHPAKLLADRLIERGYADEPFERILKGLQEVYPDLRSKDGTADDSGSTD
jgi:hypothetical protein